MILRTPIISLVPQTSLHLDEEVELTTKYSGDRDYPP
jgi:hypothetical protein